MGVDFYPCSKCEEVFNDCGWYADCEDCGEMLCGECMKELGITVGGLCKSPGPEDVDYATCPFCNKDEVSTDSLLTYSLSLLKLTREELEQKYKSNT